MATEVTESQPFKNLKELFDNVGNLKPWPEIKELRDSTDYVYSGLEVSTERMQLEKLDREVQPRTLLCHDMKGGYLEDRFIYGSKSYDSYLFYHWSVIDTFVYFSHHFITVPPFGWINAAHNHGVKVLGTVITEREGIWDVILESQEEVRRFADALILVAKFYKFDGWLLNVENTIKSEQVNNLIYFVKYLTENIHEAIRNSEIIWYDSVTNEGKLNWQNELNSKNIDFFLNCDGIYLNYNWTKSKLENSLALAKNHNRDIHDIYVGLDIWGRGCPGGGGFNSTYALQKIRHEGLSVAIFGPGWTHEFFGSKTFQEIEDLFWAQLFPYLYVHVPIYEEEEFKTSFCRGSGSLYYRCGQALYEMEGTKFKYKPFYNLSLQSPQISVPIPHMKFTSSPQLPEPKSENDRNECSKEPIQYVYETRKNVIRVLKNVVNIENKMPVLHVNSFEFCSQFSFEGGGCIKLTTNDLTTRSYHRLFLAHIEFQQDIVAIIAYKEIESSIANGSQHEPILVLGNNTGLKSIVHYKSRDLVSNWKKCVYRTNMRTVNEIGISFARSNVCYLGEIILKQKQRHLDANSTDHIATRIQSSFPNTTSNKSIAANIANVKFDIDRAGQEKTDATISKNNFICDTLEGGNKTNKAKISENRVSRISKNSIKLQRNEGNDVKTDVKQNPENLKKDSTPEFQAIKTSSTVSAPLFVTSFFSSAFEALTLSDNKCAKTVQTLDPASRTYQKAWIHERCTQVEFATPKSSILTPVCDNAESRSTPFCWKPTTTTTLSSPTFQVSTASQTLHNSPTSKSSILTPTISSLSNKQHAFGDASTSQFLTAPTSKSKESVCDNAERRSTPFCWKPKTTTTLSSPTFQVPPTASETLHNSPASKSSILTPTTSSLSNKQHAFGDASTSQFLTAPTSKSKESVCDNAESRSTPFCFKPTTTTTLSSPTFQVSTASQTLHNFPASKSSILTPTTSSLSNKQHAFGDASTSQFLTAPTSKSKESVRDDAESRSTPFCFKPTTTTTLSSPTFQVSTVSQTLHNFPASKSSILTPTTSSLSNKQHAFGDASTSQFLTAPTSKSKESVRDDAESRSTPFCWKPTTTTTLSSPTFQVPPTVSETLHNSPASKSSILTPTTSSLSNKQHAFGDASTSQFLTAPTSKSKESVRDNAESRSTPFCWKPTTTTTLSSPTFQVSTASQTLHNFPTYKSSILTPTTSSLSNKQHAFGDASTSQFLTAPTSKSKESVRDDAESRSTPFCWKPTTTTTLSSPTFQVPPTVSETLHNSPASKSSILTPTTSSLSNKQHAFGDASTSQFLTAPTSKSKESVRDDAESRSTPFCFKPTTTTTLSSPTFQVSTASQTLHNFPTYKSSILTPTTSSLSNKQHAFGDASTSQFLTAPTSKSKESVRDDAESRSTPFCFKPTTTTTLSSPTFQVSTVSQTLHNFPASKSSILTPTTSSLSNKQHAFGDASTSQFLTAPTSKSKESVRDDAESRSTPFCFKPTTTTTLSSPTFQLSTASQTLHNFPASKSSILTPTTSSLSNKQHAFGDASTSQFLTAPTSKSKESVRDNAESRSTPFCWKPTTTTTLSSPTFQVSTASQTLHNFPTYKSSILTPTTSSLSNKQHAFGDASTSQFLTAPTSKSKESVRDDAESRSTPFCWKPTTTTTLSSPTFQVPPTVSETLHNSPASKSSILTPTTSSLSNKQHAFGDASTSQFLTAPTSKTKESVRDDAESRSTPFCFKPTTTTTLSSPTFQVSTASQTLHNFPTYKSSILTPTTSSLSNKQHAFGDASTSQFLTAPTSKSKESVRDDAESRSTPFCWKPTTTTTLSSPTFQVPPTVSETLHNSPASKSSILTPTTSSLSNKQHAFGDASTSQFLTAPTSKSKESVRDDAESRSTRFCFKPTTTTTLSSPTFQLSTASQTLHNFPTYKSSILTPTTSSLSNKQHAFGDASTSQFLTAPTSKSKESVRDDAESRSTPFCWKPTTTTTLSSPTFQVPPTVSETLHNSPASKSSILTPTTSSLSNKQCEFGGAISCKFSTSAVLENKSTACDSTITNQKETTCNTTISRDTNQYGIPTAISTSFVTLSATSIVSGNTTFTMSTSESTPLIHVHQTFIFNAIPTESVVMPTTLFNFSANIKPAVSTRNEASIDFPGYTFSGPNPELAAFPQCTTTSSFSTSQPVTQIQQLSTSSAIPLKCAFNVDSSPGDCAAEPASIQSEGFDFNPPNTSPSFHFNVYKFNAPVQVQQGTASIQVQRSTASTQEQRKYRKYFRRLK